MEDWMLLSIAVYRSSLMFVEGWHEWVVMAQSTVRHRG
jgi:hypothetical protein